MGTLAYAQNERDGVGHFLLTDLLLENMKNTARNSHMEGRIVNVSSEGHRFAYSEGIRFEKINDQAGYTQFGAYGQSKLANILHANELTRRFKGAATTCYVALHPQVKGVGGKYFVDSTVCDPRFSIYGNIDFVVKSTMGKD
ncbi:hypothetical protein QJS10_CPB18g01598 [Acorus calamus]|uniref:Uncharacterized protein n=1 Tax=Acorus calamus TaxID=4465 RepID=A0AAV9CRZ9_ACOCL|nr:hypothetical protein QJS10_CPB18g01598 [Acorus calamus]